MTLSARHRQPPPVDPGAGSGRSAATALAALLLAAATGSAHAGCVDEDKFERSPPVAAAAASAPPPAAPRAQLQALVKDALARSNGINAARLLADAAQQDTDEARANKLPQASFTGSLGPSLGTGTGGRQLQARAGVTVGASLYDGGRSDRLVDWRLQQAEAAKLGLLSTQEQITLATTSMALERSRFRQQAVIYSQYVRKMGCLVEALETIAAADKGRLSELVQARKQFQQAELQQVQAVSQARQVEAKLRRVVGDGLPGADGLSSLLLAVPELPEVLSAAERSTDIAQLDANAASLFQLARVVESGTRPQVSWNVGGNAAVQSILGKSNVANPNGAALSAGVTVSIPLLNPSIDHSVQAAKLRARAAELQRAEALESRRQRIVEVHEQASSAWDRVKRVSLVLRDSDKLRNFTLQQWQQMGRRSLFDVIGAEGEHYNLRVQYINAMLDGQQMNATLQSLGGGLTAWLQP